MKLAIGLMPCQCCGKEVVIKENERETLSYACQWCDDAPYQRTGTLAYKSWCEKIKPLPGNAPVVEKPIAELKTVARPVPVVARKSSGLMFD